ncbi:MAG: ectonucleotide pyrophosphatase/phosphodiesterase [Christensenellaceae bacterium]|jgi:hypothetical protein|nr:ectonucleotide pyrophosphatase/phosphodiesterase [Christensenellaceae bacterium]
MSKLLMVSFDAVPSDEWAGLCAHPNIAAFAARARVTLDVQSVFPTNTYPVHCSVITGRQPCDHGVIGNTEPFPKRHPRWVTDAAAIRSKTLWQAAREQGLTVASVLWPCTGFAREIRWNVPELPPRPGQNQLLANLRAGSKLLQAGLFLKYGKMLKGVDQPGLDAFVTACAADLLRRKNPDLTLVHLTAYDTLCHRYGRGAAELSTAFEALDQNLGILLKAAGPDVGVIVFSDHAQLNVHSARTPNDLLVELGLLNRGETENEPYAPGAFGCFIECCGGSAFFHAGSLSGGKIALVREKIAASDGFLRFLTEEELRSSGRGDLAFGYGLREGYIAEASPEAHKGNHGYPLDMPDYTVFYAAMGDGLTPGERGSGGSLLGIAPLAAQMLGIHWP